MADFQHKPGSGSLFQSDQKGNDRAPTHRGELCLADGTIIKIAGWRKEGRNGPFLSLSIDKPREEAPRADDFRGSGSSTVAGSRPGSSFDADLNDEIPF